MFLPLSNFVIRSVIFSSSDDHDDGEISIDFFTEIHFCQCLAKYTTDFFGADDGRRRQEMRRTSQETQRDSKEEKRKKEGKNLR